MSRSHFLLIVNFSVGCAAAVIRISIPTGDALFISTDHGRQNRSRGNGCLRSPLLASATAQRDREDAKRDAAEYAQEPCWRGYEQLLPWRKLVQIVSSINARKACDDGVQSTHFMKMLDIIRDPIYKESTKQRRTKCVRFVGRIVRTELSTAGRSSSPARIQPNRPWVDRDHRTGAPGNRGFSVCGAKAAAAGVRWAFARGFHGASRFAIART